VTFADPFLVAAAVFLTARLHEGQGRITAPSLLGKFAATQDVRGANNNDVAIVISGHGVRARRGKGTDHVVGAARSIRLL